MKRFIKGVAFNFCLILLSMMIAQAQTPLDLLQPRSAPVQSVSLSGLSPASAISIAAVNENLTAWKDRPLADLGKYFSGMRTIDNGLAGIPDTLINFSQSEVPITPSIDAEVGNDGQAPVDTDDKEGMVFP
jgi:hypothetical protein